MDETRLDLGAALVELAAVSAQRATSYKRLKQATATIARQIGGQMIEGEVVEVVDMAAGAVVEYSNRTVRWWMTHPAEDWIQASEASAAVLCRAGRPLFTARSAGWVMSDRSVEWVPASSPYHQMIAYDLAPGWIAAEAEPLELADGAAMVAFCRSEAALLVAALRDQAETSIRVWDDTVEASTVLRVR